MKEFCIVHDFVANTERFWRLFFLPGYNEQFYGSVGLVRKVLKSEYETDRFAIQARYESGRPLPDFVRRALRGRRLGFAEELHFSPAKNLVAQRVIPDFFHSQVLFRGEYRVEPLGEERIRRTYRGRLEVAVPIVGKKVEQATIREMERTHDQAAEVTRIWLAKHKEWEGLSSDVDRMFGVTIG